MSNQPSPPNPSPPCVSVRPLGYLFAAGAATAANLALWAVGYHHTIATGMLVGAACAGVVCWRQALAEERMMARLDSVATDMWWHGYATCLEDTAGEGQPRTVVRFRTPRGDKISDTRRFMNGSEHL